MVADNALGWLRLGRVGRPEIRNDPHHAWAVFAMKETRPPMLTSEPVLTETLYFLREDGANVDPLFQLLEREALRIDFDMSAHWPRIRTLMGPSPAP